MAREREKINLACMFLPLCVKYHLYNRTLSCKFEENYFSLRIKEKKCVRQLHCVAVGKTVILILGNIPSLAKCL